MKWINLYKTDGRMIYDNKQGTWVEFEEYQKMYNAAVKAKELLEAGNTKDALTILTRETCRHDYAARTIGRCLTEYTCKLCGKSKVIDSGD
jgi:hypothetical protein